MGTAETAYGPPRLWLTVVEDGKARHTVEVVGSTFTIGREASCDLTLDDPKVSRHHAVIGPGPGPVRILHDLGSANGTLVNGSPIKPTIGFTASEERVAEIGGGEVLQFGDSIVLATLADPSNASPLSAD